MAWNRLKRFWLKNKRSMSDYSADVKEDFTRQSHWRWVLIALVALALPLVVLAIIWDTEPAPFSVQQVAAERVPAQSAEPVVGAVTTATLIHIADTLLTKPGGYLSNDLMPPSVWMDNIPNWEFGVLVQVRDMSKAMREALSRSQSQSREDKDLALAEPRFNFDHRSWMLPSSENEYAAGIKRLESYLTRLTDPNDREAQFYARADNLNYWLRTVESRLGSLSQRLSASVERVRVNTDLAGDAAAVQSTAVPAELVVKTSWWEIDDVFYEARGTSWALLHLLKAAEVDFADVLEKKNARVSLQQIIRELEATQEPLGSPMILNGSGFGMLANHSLVMANYISRANAAIIDLRELLAQG
ncbi:hypothetical protein M5M_09505 [Simiduia agarivorans SA1 = DSM 21679]|uniref:DUF2333 domain-containing protein n=2 Tax=Simiduia TaxID=447467 RepID=K4KJ65_SIMAS|nr:DUF2333 family protein [Simiduia agarivorans]AFU99086.1 hypothetical protein M5M_09505 [Simiduia agarivorans SA1 = DSM 21679]